jgi:uroporphyrinogen decarboxylase
MRDPDFDNLLRVLDRKPPRRPTLFEFLLNDRLYDRLTGRKEWPDADHLGWARRQIAAYAAAGYDYIATGASNLQFPYGEQAALASLSLNAGTLIHDRESFLAYPWPDPDKADRSHLEILPRELPGNMKIIVFSPNGVLENMLRLVGYESLCFMLADDPALAAEIFDAVGSRLLRNYQLSLDYPCVGAIIDNDDWGFKTGPMLSPDQLRRYVFPWHRQIIEAAHASGKPVILHACGNLEAMMDEVIGLGIDGKHSYEDNILPVEDAYERYAGRIAVIGGIDVDFVCRAAPAAVHERSRAMLERSRLRGGYALGT